MVDIGELNLAQGDGNVPTTLASGSAAGESGVSVLGLRFEGAVHFSATPRQHLVWFQMSAPVRYDCRIGGHSLTHQAPLGQLSICPAGVDSAAHADEGASATVVAVDPAQLALAAAEEAALDVQLVERFEGCDRRLFELARVLALESADNYPNGPLFWNDVAAAFLGNLVARHTLQGEAPARGILGKEVLARVRDYVVAHLDEPIEVAALAKIAARSPFHFSRVFARSVGVTPHQYVVRLRLQRAIELVRDGRLSLAQIAARTGFADQSHLSRWVRRIHGVSLSKLN
jgi:AraC family transcriptional regulator